MSEYEIKQYQKGFEVDQEKVGKEVAKSFLAPHQTNATRLKERYSQEDFDPETRLYAFKDGKMVGFLTSRVLPEEDQGTKIASLTPPSVLEGYEPAKKLLFKKALEVLKKKGAQKVRSNFGAYSSMQEETAKKLGYNLVQVNSYVYSIDVSAIDTSVPYDSVIDYNYDKHKDKCAKVLATEYGQDVEWANTFLDRINSEENSQREPFVIFEENKLNAFAILSPNMIDSTICHLTAIFATNEDYMKQILSKIATVFKTKKFSRLQTGFTEESDIKEKKYKPIKFKLIGSSSVFEKEL
jgi:hypothetical protein